MNNLLKSLNNNVLDVYIYGAGKIANVMYHFFKYNSVAFKGFIVSKNEGNPEVLYGHRVYSVDCVDLKKAYIVVAIKDKKIQQKLFDIFFEKEVGKYVMLSDKEINAIESWTLNERINRSEYYKVIDDAPVEKFHLVFAEKNDLNRRWRLRVDSSTLMQECSFDNLFGKNGAISEFEELYGKYRSVKELEKKDCESLDRIKVFMARSHVDQGANLPILPTWIETIQVGAALTQQNISEIKDNIGDNISERNGNYSECSAIYWIWKNITDYDYIGLCHYRRHFDINADEMQNVLNNKIDVVVTTPTFVNESIGEFFKLLIPKSDVYVLKQAIKDVASDYYIYAEKFFESRFYPPCNMFIMRRELFELYCEFCFKVTFEVERIIAEKNILRNDRYMGYLVECLMGIFLMSKKDKLSITYSDMKFYK